jgi:hypothetical protein
MVKLFGKKKESNSQEMYEKEGGKRGHRAKGDLLAYYIFHSLLGAIIFLAIAIQLDLLSLRTDAITYLFTLDYWSIVLLTFFWSIIASVIGRILAYLFLQGLYWKTATKNIWELNTKGINKMSFRWFIALFITALIWTMGVLAIIQYSVFGNTEDVVSMIIVYVSVKFLIFIITKVVIDAKT